MQLPHARLPLLKLCERGICGLKLDLEWASGALYIAGRDRRGRERLLDDTCLLLDGSRSETLDEQLQLPRLEGLSVVVASFLPALLALYEV